ncbi:oxidoreductase [Actinoallomurus rhizosphaericola]|uniref:oxidoreductase n=1 Tax=Actinoallomurus rhizosphaericola TaxID=2952536 RepID=UPI002093385F|nr:oxidoreductase [Actinoallomurus rhizosphaericola]MCO5996611.1 oxidoreductase [Actinoallomurus rhizosphaericola]
MAETSDGRVWLITGTSSGLGRALAEAVVARGDRLVAAVRRPETNDDLVAEAPDRVKVVRTDVTSTKDVHEVVEAAAQGFGRIDAVVNNAGFGLLGGVEEATEDQIRSQLEVNTFGVFNVTRAVLPVLRAQRSGHIFMISSVAGQFGAPGLAWYDASKFALEGFSEALAAEVRPIGAKVTIIEPGNFRTKWAGDSMVMAAARIGDYAPSIDPVRALFSGLNGNQPGDPAKAAQTIIRMLDEPEPPLRLVLGGDALELIRQKLARQTAELDKWESVTFSTDFDKA